MEREKLERILVEYMDGTLNEQDQSSVEKELRENPAAKILLTQLTEMMTAMDHSRELVPSEALKNSFEHFLKQEVEKPKAKSAMMVPVFYRMAAGVALFAVIGVTAYWIHKDIQNEKRLNAIAAELDSTKREMMKLLNNDLSASQRMQGITVAFEVSRPDDEIVHALVTTMNSDPNSNVRLAALDALGKFSSEKGVRNALIEALATQKDPVVQIALIQLMVKMKEKGVVKELERMTKDSKTMKAVKDEAYSGIFKLS